MLIQAVLELSLLGGEWQGEQPIGTDVSASVADGKCLLTSCARQLNRGPTAENYLFPDSWSRAQEGSGGHICVLSPNQ